MPNGSRQHEPTTALDAFMMLESFGDYLDSYFDGPWHDPEFVTWYSRLEAEYENRTDKLKEFSA